MEEISRGFFNFLSPRWIFFFFYRNASRSFLPRNLERILRFLVEDTLSSNGRKGKKKERETKIEGEMLKQASQGNGMKRGDKKDGDKRSFSRYNSRRREGDKCFF